ncbi:ABC transporter substrate-binding protein [Microbacterium sp. SORGH_AS_0862]|uniref:ABC transporter substrate-binding protein n=1 Tax=Microbacterium sp. SORGH_AS_0862 TaxID=3041789 RepID=UPI0027933E97|nr:ABC transporter substrate-binding protein [Microbacterium sp. SORGH_AS_0862]MDQ1205835.1 urea transport system substrate-binding protein [Microbacterium sp. SORGH_AS_0862]
MSGIVLTATRDVALTPEAVFETLGSWLFGASFERLEVGRPLTLTVPFGGAASGFTIFGRIRRIVWGQSIVIEHSQPWRGTVRLRLTPLPIGARVTLSCDVDDAGVGWMVRRTGIPSSAPESARGRRWGLLTTKSGSGAVFALGTENAALLAIDELNAAGAGMENDLVVGDDGTDPAMAAVEAERLIAAGCRVIVAAVISASFTAVQQVAQRHGVLAVHSVLNEGGRPARSVLRLGERPADQLRAALTPLMRETGGSRCYIVGHTYSWSRSAARVARGMLADLGAGVAGEARLPLGHHDYAPVVERIRRSGADLVLSTLVGDDEVRFERSSHELGLRSTATTLSLVLDESTREHIGAEQSAGVWAAMGYFEASPSSVNQAFVARYRARFGAWAPPLSSLSESVYSTILLLERALADDPDATADAWARAVRQVRLETPRGLLTFGDGETYASTIRVAIAGQTGFHLL